MKKFLAIYLGARDGDNAKNWNALDDASRQAREQAGMTGWMNWASHNQRSIVDHGTPLGKTKRIDPKGISDVTNAVCAYTIIEAASHEDAAKMFLNHPHFSQFPGDSVEIMECLPIPGM